ncbi:MAG: DUF2971 domain-containing protein [Sarcina sp.]
MLNEGIYHFTSIDALIKIILTDSLLLNNIKNMNDLTESEALYDNMFLLNNEETYSKIQFEDERNKHKKDPYEIIKYKNKLRENVEHIKKNIFICSFNKLNKNESIYEKFSLWGYYGDKSRGVAIKFNETKLKKIFDKLVIDTNFIGIQDIVKYENYNDLESINDKALKLLINNRLEELLTVKYFSKSIEWKHENEYRFVISLIKDLSKKYDNVPDEIYLFNIIDCIDEIIVGVKISKNDIGILNCIKEKLCPKIIFTPVEKYKKKLIYEDKLMVEGKEAILKNIQHTHLGITLTAYRESDFYARFLKKL